MERTELYRLIKQKPFRPFRVFVNDGRTFDIRYTIGMNLLAETYIVIGVPDTTGPYPVCDHTEYVRLDQITHAELLPAEPSKTA